MDRNTLDAMLKEITRQAVLAEKRGERWSTREWTRRVLNTLTQLGTARGYTPYPNPRLCEGEWLYDVIWVRMNEQNRVISVPLVAEIEWGKPGDVWDDFQKLLVARAGVRIMIFDNHAGLLDELQKHVCQYKNGGDRYLLAQYVSLAEGFMVVEV